MFSNPSLASSSHSASQYISNVMGTPSNTSRSPPAADRTPSVPVAIAPKGGRPVARLNGAMPPPKRKRLACKECRQGKIRCESMEGSQPCSRCSSLRLVCVYDTRYRRHNKRSRLQALTAEVERLRAARSSPTKQSPSSHPSSFSPQNEADCHSIIPSNKSPPNLTHDVVLPSFLDAHESPSPSSATRDDFLPAAQHQALGNARLTTGQIDDLFRIYFRHYHHYIPIVERWSSPDEYHTRCPLLFWAIIAVACRRDEEGITLAPSLLPALKSLLWQTIGTPPNSRQEIKAMILLSLWPVPTSSMSTDTSYILASAAKTSAMHVGIHRPQAVQDFSRFKLRLSAEETKDALMIWSACFIAAENVTSWIGQQPLFVSDTTLDTLCNSGNANSYGLPQDFYHLILIWRFCNRVHRVMASRERRVGSLGENDSGVLLPLYEAELEELRLRLGTDLSETNEIMFLNAALQLRSYYFLERHPHSSLKEGVLKAYRAAVIMIQKCSRREIETHLLTYGPGMFSLALSMAAIFILKVVRDDSFFKFVDCEEGHRALNRSIGLLRKCSLEDNDLCGRFSKILAQLASAGPDQDPASTKELKVRTRLGGSLLHDTLWTWREGFAGMASGTTRASTPAYASAHQAPTSAIAITPCHDGVDQTDAGFTAGYDIDMSCPADHAQHLSTVSATSPNPHSFTAWSDGDTVGGLDVDLIDEINNKWLGQGNSSGGGFSGLMAMYLDESNLLRDLNGDGHTCNK